MPSWRASHSPEFPKTPHRRESSQRQVPAWPGVGPWGGVDHGEWSESSRETLGNEANSRQYAVGSYGSRRPVLRRMSRGWRKRNALSNLTERTHLPTSSNLLREVLVESQISVW